MTARGVSEALEAHPELPDRRRDGDDQPFRALGRGERRRCGGRPGQPWLRPGRAVRYRGLCLVRRRRRCPLSGDRREGRAHGICRTGRSIPSSLVPTAPREQPPPSTSRRTGRRRHHRPWRSSPVPADTKSRMSRHTSWRSSAAGIAEAAAERLRVTHPELAVTTRVEDCPAELTLVDASANASLVVVGSRGRGVFEGMMLGSVSHAVIHGARGAVAVVGEGQR